MDSLIIFLREIYIVFLILLQNISTYYAKHAKSNNVTRILYSIKQLQRRILQAVLLFLSGN